MDLSFIVRFCHQVGTEDHVTQLTETVLISGHGPLQKSRHKNRLNMLPGAQCLK